MWILLISLFLVGCSSGEEHLKKQNRHWEALYRLSDDSWIDVPSPAPQELPRYEWDLAAVPKVSREFFRCRGSSTHPERTEERRGEMVRYVDCRGRHSLPTFNEEEFIYPVLIELLNMIQEMTGKKVVITSGHRCPEHNTYVDASIANQSSKHQVGAEVAFYVEGMERDPGSIVEVVQRYYKEHPVFGGQKEWTEFKRYEKGNTNVRTLPWYNKEVFVKIFMADEGRDGDNRHPYPYLSMQVRYDRDAGERVSYSWEKANKFYRK